MAGISKRKTEMKKEQPKEFDPHSVSYQGKDSREGRLHTIKTEKGEFRFKDNRKGED